MLARQLLRSALESGVLRGQGLNGLARDRLVEVADLAHELADLLPLSEHLLLGAGQLALCVEGSLPPGRLDPVMLFTTAASPVMNRRTARLSPLRTARTTRSI